jgi:ferredoxin
MRGWRLTVDPIACDGHGLCADLFPEGIDFDDWGFPIVSGDEIPEHLLSRARHAVRTCPKLALRLEQAATLQGAPSAQG